MRATNVYVSCHDVWAARFVASVLRAAGFRVVSTWACAVRHGRRAIGCDLNPEYADLARRRVASVTPNLPEPP